MRFFCFVDVGFLLTNFKPKNSALQVKTISSSDNVVDSLILSRKRAELFSTNDKQEEKVTPLKKRRKNKN